MADQHYDFIVIGSGFGGSVAAMRLSEKGYRILVLEKGKRWETEDFPKSNWNFQKFLWVPFLRWFGLMQMTFFRKLFVVTGVGVGGGSLIYGNVHMMPPDSFFEDPTWSHIKNWKTTLMPFYDKARYMLGSTRYEKEHFEDEILKQVARDMGVGHTYRHVDHIGVYLGSSEGDPYFGGLGPLRKPCIECAGCMVGCRYHAKNSLDKNYLWFAEKYFGTKIIPEAKVYKIEKTIQGTYQIYSHSTTGWFSRRKVFSCKGVVVSAGVLGTLELLLRQKVYYKTLPDISSMLGRQVLTNCEMISGVSLLNRKLNHGVAISTLFNPDKNTFVELCKYPDGSGSLFRMAGPAALNGNRVQRIGSMFAHFFKRPFDHIRLFFHKDIARHSVIMLIMQTLPNHLHLKFRKTLLGTGLRLVGEKNYKIPEYIQIGQQAMLNYAAQLKGIPQNALTEVIFGMATTAHILGGCKMSHDSETGVINERMQLHGYPEIYVLDGSVIQANPGVNPSLSITALSEYAMSLIEPHPDNTTRLLEVLIREKMQSNECDINLSKHQ